MIYAPLKPENMWRVIEALPERADRDNQFLKDCGIAPVEFDYIESDIDVDLVMCAPGVPRHRWFRIHTLEGQ